MRVYNENGKLQTVICNQCKKQMHTENQVLENDWLSVDKAWGYFSNKDGVIHSFDLCEQCYDAMIQGFALEVAVTEQTELM